MRGRRGISMAVTLRCLSFIVLFLPRRGAPLTLAGSLSISGPSVWSHKVRRPPSLWGHPKDVTQEFQQKPMEQQRQNAISRSAFLHVCLASAATALTLPAAAAPTTDESPTIRPISFPSPMNAAAFSSSSSSSSSSSLPLASAPPSTKTWEESVSGFVSGAALSATKTLVKFPLDTASVRLQMPENSLTVWNVGALLEGSFSGILPVLVSNVPAGALFFAVKDFTKEYLQQQSSWPKWLTTSLAVTVAQIPYWLLRNPSEVIKTRQQARLEGYGGDVTAGDAFRRALSNDNDENSSLWNRLSLLYCGYFENVLYAVPADVTKFVGYEFLTHGQKDLVPWQAALYGALATAMAQYITTPLDVVRNRVMTNDDKEETTYGQRFQAIAAENELFAGATPRVGKALLSGALQFATYEETKQSMRRFFLTQQPQ